MNPLGLVFLGAVIVLSIAAAVEAQRGYRSCLCHSPRRRFKTAAARKAHERCSWGSFT